MINCLSGSVIRIKGVFKDFGDNLVDPANTKLVIYDKNYKTLETKSGLTKESTGVYYYDYTTIFSVKDKQYYCEISGDVDGKPIVCRDTFTTQFIITRVK